jgi:hypothetical protein
MKASWQTVVTIFRKEIVDALRDRRTLLTVLISSVLMGPLVLLAISALVASLESNAEQREVVVAGLAAAPTLQNYFERQTFTVREAPADFERQLRSAKLPDAVVVVPKDFEAALQRGDAPIVEIVADSANQRSQASSSRTARLLGAFSRERATLNLAMRGVSPDVLEPVQVEERDLASTQTRATQITGMLPFFVLMAVLTGALNAALDTTAGERERGSLEPLLMNPNERWALVLGKWGAVAGRGDADRGAELLQLPARPVAAAQRYAGRDVPVRATRGLAVSRRAATVCGRGVGAADGGGDPLQDLQGGAGEHDGRDARGLAAAADQCVQPRTGVGVVPVGAGAGAEPVDDAGAEGRGLRRRSTRRAADRLRADRGGRGMVRGAHLA